MAAIQSRFEVAVPELPDHIDPASYSKNASFSILECYLTRDGHSDVLIPSIVPVPSRVSLSVSYITLRL